MLPRCVIVGAQRWCSTFLHRYLSEHPDILTPRGEVHFFEDPSYDAGRIRDMEALLAPGRGKRIIAVKRPNYVGRPECAARIARHCPDAEVVMILRHPVERAVSAYFHYVSYGFIPARDPESGVPAILDLRYERSHPAAADILEFGYYAKHLARYLEHYPASRIHITFYDDLQRDSVGTLSALCRSLRLDSAILPRTLDARPQAVIYSLPRLRVRRLRNRFVYAYDENRGRAYEKKPTPFGRFVNRAVRAVDRRILKPTFPSRKPRLSPGLRARLAQLYAEDVLSLEKLTGRDLAAWKS